MYCRATLKGYICIVIQITRQMTPRTTLRPSLFAGRERAPQKGYLPVFALYDGAQTLHLGLEAGGFGLGGGGRHAASRAHAHGVARAAHGVAGLDGFIHRPDAANKPPRGDVRQAIENGRDERRTRLRLSDHTGVESLLQDTKGFGHSVDATETTRPIRLLNALINSACHL